MTDSEFASEFIQRMNKLLNEAGPEVRKDIARLFKLRIQARQATEAHHSIQVDEERLLSFLGFLNGVVGVIQEGPKAGYGYITGTFDSENNLQFFSKTMGS